MHTLARIKDTSSDCSTEDLGTLGFDIKKNPSQPNAYNLVIKGFLAPGWTGRLTAGLAQQRIGIVRGEAEKVSASAWHSSFELKSSPFVQDPLSIDYLILASTELPHSRSCEKIVLREFLMEPCSRHDGSLYLEVKGVDRLGFLGDLLDYFSMRCLFPVKMTVETVADTALDRFWLRGVGGSRPSDSIAAAMKESLERLLINNA